MKVKTTLAAAATLMAVLTTSEARAEGSCTLTVNGSTNWAFVWVGQSFTYAIDIPYPSRPPSGPPSPLPGSNDLFTIVFTGTKDGQGDTPPGGEIYPASFGYGYSVLTGYGNPGGVSGTYQRQAVVYSKANGFFICSTNIVVVQLQ